MECWSLKSIIDHRVLDLVPQCDPQALREHSFFKVRLQEVSMGQACPRSCNCYQTNEVHCTFRSLLTIPSGLPLHTRRINLGFNSINRIHNSSLAGLKKVELLMLHSNGLHHLPDAAFRDMKSLQILKLSYNKLREIASSLTFSGLTSLLRLYLDHNLLQHIHPRALLQLTSLRLLRLQGNRLHQLHPHTLCTLSLLNTYYFSTLRHLDLSNNSLTTLPRETLATAPLLETLALQANPWSCDCRMTWFLTWSLSHPGLLKCPSGPQCPICASPNSLQGQGLLDQTDLSCTSPVIPSPGRDTSLETELSEIQSSESFREPLGTASLGLSDQQGNSVNLECNITHSSDFQDIAPPPDLSLSSSSPLPLALSLSLECPVEKQSYENLWKILAYYSETAVRLEREIMLSKAPALAYRYRQAEETDGYYHTGVKASVKAKPQWLLQPAISIQLNRAQSNGHKVQLIYSTRVTAHPDPASLTSTSAPPSQPWVLISTNHTTTALAALAGSKVELSCPLLSSGNPKVQWVLPDGSMLISPSISLDGRLHASTSGLLLHKVQLSDAGIYHCIARAGSDVDVLPLHLAVEESSVPPLGEQVGPPVTGNIGEPISLSCKASGSPASHMSWVLPDGNIVRRGFAVSGGLTIQSNGSLSLSDPSQRDAGHYRCIAVNQYGSDSLSMQLELNSRHLPPLRTSFPTGPQSAAGRSTKIRAPLLVEEGSGDEKEEEESTLFSNRKHPRPLQPPPNRRYPTGKPRRPGPRREGPLRRGGGPLSSNDQKRNRFENRHRVTTNKQRIDPQKWADLLAKIRQKTVHTNNSQPIEAGKPTAKPQGGGKDGDTGKHDGHHDTERGRAEGAGVEAETEGPSTTYFTTTTSTSTTISFKVIPTTRNPTTIVRSRPRIADPHIRTVSFPAESTARLACEAQGEPKPSITWTKVATGAVISIHSRAQRFEVLPNGTLVIQNIQLQDRGTYICSAHSFIGRDRLLTTLEVWTRPPRMQLASYREATTHQGGEVHLECQADGVPSPLLSWVLPDRSVLTSTAPSTSRITMDKNGTLHISVTLPSDRGVYRCVASNSAGAASASARVHVSSLPPVIQQPREEHLLLFPGWPVYAHCSARGAPPPTLRWRIPDGTLVRPSQFLHGNLFVLPNGTLHIRGVGPKDSGNYECTASNAVGADKRTVRVEIEGGASKAQIVSTSPSITAVHYGVFLQLHCSVTGNPSPIIVWRTPNRKLVDMHFSFDRRLKVHTNGTLSVQRVTEKDAGDYLCIARNKVSDDYRLLRVSVVTKPAKIEPKQPFTHMVSLGKPLKVDCQASGLPHPAVRWSLPDGTMVNSVLQGEDRGGRAQRLTVFVNGTLLVPAVGMGEEGDYTCYVENQGGQDTMKVKVKIMMASPPNFSDDRSRHVIKVRQGATAKIRCQASGVPAPTVTWFSPTGRVIPRSLGSGLYTERVVAISDGTLEVRLAQKIDTGNYTCRASSPAGENSMVVGLDVEAPNHGLSGPVGGRVKQRVVKGQTVLLPCPSQGSPPPRLAWLLPGNGVLPAPYYGSRYVVHRNGSLELRGVRASDRGTFACVVRGEREQTRIQVELEVSEPQNEARSPHRGVAVERPVQESRLIEAPRSGASLHSAQSLNSKPVLPETLHPRIPVTQTPLHRPQSLPAVPRPVGPPPRSASPVSEPAVSTRTAPLVSIVNGETLRLSCSASHTQGALSWTLPSGKVLSLGESGDSDRYLVQEDGTLTVQQASVFDRGSYTCRSTSVDSSSVSVVTVAVIVIAYPPRITAGPSPVTYTRPGVAVELPCQTIATPRAAITWETPDLTQLRVMGQARIYGNRYLSPQGSLVIQNPTNRDTGFYRCTAKNVIGVDTQVTYLHVI
ncbi:matrix-remodeling-associated protein 5-like [Anarhichas minor]|uniref:matrix-remodeling-associated protein 5-like n=1 Tax=Anarhichas minor TaxID=65739 RepID=UPI003F736455